MQEALQGRGAEGLRLSTIVVAPCFATVSARVRGVALPFHVPRKIACSAALVVGVHASKLPAPDDLWIPELNRMLRPDSDPSGSRRTATLFITNVRHHRTHGHEDS